MCVVRLEKRKMLHDNKDTGFPNKLLFNPDDENKNKTAL